MPETHDFEKIAQRLVIDGWRVQDMRVAIAEQLRQIWNARGAADESLLKKYMAFIVAREGSNYLDSLDAADHLSGAELAELQRIADA